MNNIAKLLENCPEGTKLYSPLFGEVKFLAIDSADLTIVVETERETHEWFSPTGEYKVNKSHMLYSDAECLLFPSKDCRTWKGWKAPRKPKFKVNDWIIYDRTFTIPIQIVEVNQKDGIYVCKSIEGLCGNYNITHTDENYHLWTIKDAKDGDVLVSGTDNPFIYDGNIEFSYAGAYVGISRNGRVRLDMFPSNVWTSIENVKPATKEQYDLLFAKIKEIGYQWDSEKKELRKIISPKFQVGKWIAYNENRTSLPPKQIIMITGNRYIVSGNCTYDFKTLEADWHLWTIADAKKGDILYSPCCKLLWIYKDNNSCYVGNNLNYNKDSMVINSPICIPIDVVPAAKEQCDLLFQKIEENGYEWIADKKELRKIKPHYDISNFHAGMPVLVRPDNDCCWDYSVFSRNTGNEYWHFAVCNGVSFTQCIPFEGNEHLLGTTDMCDECYINW